MLKGFTLGPLFIAWFDLALTALMLAVVIPLGMLYGKRLAARGLNLNTAFEKGPRAWIVIFGFLALCGLIGLTYRLPHLLTPAALGLLEPGSWLVARAGAVFLAAMAAPLAGGSGGRQVRQAALLGAVCVIAVTGLQGWFLRPIAQKQIWARHARDGSILQSTSVTCTAAAFANALRQFGIEASEAESARVLGTRDSGTSQAQLINGARHYGLFAHYVSVRPEHVARMNRPAIVSVDLRVIMHSILVYGHDPKGNLLVVDPISGKGKLSPQRYLDQLKVREGVVLTDRPLPEVNADSPAFLIRRAQAVLVAEGYLKQANGVYDAAMSAAVSTFQRHWQLPVSGHIDDTTWLLLTGPSEPQSAPIAKAT